jgi:hypothetical protein
LRGQFVCFTANLSLYRWVVATMRTPLHRKFLGDFPNTERGLDRIFNSDLTTI